MSDELLDLAIATAGGRELWNTLRGLKIDISIGEAGQTWRRLQVRFPPEIVTHSPDQVFYFDTLGMQRRMDYITEVNGSTLVGHYTSRYRTLDGLLVATRRRVFRRNPDNSVNLNLPSITLDVRDVELVRPGDEQAEP